MYVVHAQWQPPATPKESGVMFWWAESSEGEQPPKKQGRWSQIPQLHPFHILGEELQALLKRFANERGKPEQIKLLLPTTQYGPIPSPQLVHDWEFEGQKSVHLRRWEINGLRYLPWNNFRLLTHLPEKEDLPFYLRIGDEVRYWQKVVHLVLEILAQQKVQPALLQENQKTLYAQWQPVLDSAEDGPRIAQLLAAMPPICRAEKRKRELGLSPRTLLETFLQAMTHTLAQRWGSSAAPTPPPRRRDPVYGWLRSLFKPPQKIGGSIAQLKHLLHSYNLWLRNLHLAGNKNFRVTFRLEAPPQQKTAEEKNWELYFMLQSREDPSLLIPAIRVWQAKGNLIPGLKYQVKHPRGMLLAGLGYAARLFPPLQEGLMRASPTSVNLDTYQAFDFLREVAPLLEMSGFGVLVPPWWNKPGTRLGVRLKLSSSSSEKSESNVSQGNLSFENLIQYQWKLSVANKDLSQEEFETLAALKAPLVRIRGQWVQLDPDQIEKAIEFWQKQDLSDMITLHEAVRMGLDMEGRMNGLPVEGVEVSGWFQEWLDQFTGDKTLSLLPPPEGLQAQLRPYQQYGYSWLHFLQQYGLGACLADDMGLGKTLEAITIVLHQKEKEELLGSVLVVCPTSVITNWAKEIERFAPDLRTMIHHGPDRLKDEVFIQSVSEYDMVLTSYNLARIDADFFKDISWAGLILDEAQNIKNPDTKQAREIRQFSAQFRFALTGTPIENRLSELWSIMQFLNPGYLGSRKKFQQEFVLPIERYQEEASIDRLKKFVTPFILRRVKTDPTVIQDLPEKLETKVYCYLSEEQATLYEAVVKESMEKLYNTEEGIERKGLILSMLMQLKQICNHPAQFLHQVGRGTSPTDVEKQIQRSGKLARLNEMLEEAISVGDRVLIFTQYSEMGHLLKSHLQHQLGVSTQFLYGATPAKKRAKMVDRFQDDPQGPPIFILSLKAGGTGLNLTRANHVFHFDRWWNPAVENQATDRAFRIGQTRNVQVHKFICTGTLEEMIDGMIESKKALAESVVGQEENWLTELSTTELRELVSLRREALG